MKIRANGTQERMDIKGVCYDVGRAYGGRFLTPAVFDPVPPPRELQIIQDDLHANAVRFQGRDIAADHSGYDQRALELGYLPGSPSRPSVPFASSSRPPVIARPPRPTAPRR